MKVDWRTSAMRILRHAGAALRQDLDQALGLQPGQGLRHRKARNAEPLADLQLVDVGARREFALDDGLAQERSERAP